MKSDPNDLENELEDIDDLSDFDFDEELDFDFESDNDIEFEEKDSKGRKPILKTAKKIASSAASDLKSKSFGEHGNMLLENVMSNDSRSAVNDIKNMADSVRDEFLKGIAPIQEELSNFMENIDERIPKSGTIRKIFDFAKQKVKKEEYDSFSSSFDEVNNMLESIDYKLESVKEKEELEGSFKKADLDYKKLSGSLLTSINSNIKIGNEYNKIFNKKSLELQYKTYLLLKDTLATHKQQHTERLKQNEAIIKNTGLPEYVKIKTTERLGQSFSNKMANSISESLFQGDSPIKLMTENIVNNTTAKLNNFVSQLAQANMGLSMTKGEKIDKSQLAGSALASGAMKSGYWLLGKTLGKKRTQGLENSIQAFAADPESYLKDKLESDPTGLFGKIKDKVLRGALDLATTHNKFKDIKLETTGLKDQAVFDGETHRSINMVIPKLLSKIHNEIQGLRTGSFSNEKELRFDHDTLNFLTTKETKEKMDKNIQTEIFDRTIKSVNNITNVVKDRLSGVSFYGKELIMANLGNAILAYITENGRISPTDLTKKDFIQYFDPKIQPKILASMSIFQDIIKNDSDKSIVYRTFSSSLTAIKTSPALLNKHSAGMNADLLLKDNIYSTDIYGGKVSANGAGLSKKMYERTKVKKHKTDINTPDRNWSNNEINLSDIVNEVKEDINKFKNRDNKPKSFFDLNSDYKGNVKYNKHGVDFIINKDKYENADNDIKFKMKYDFELESLIREYQDPQTSKERKEEVRNIIKSLLTRYDNERINKEYGNKFIRAGKKFTGVKDNIDKMSDKWLSLIDEGKTLEEMFGNEENVSNTETLKRYGLTYSPNSFSVANDSDSKIINNIKYVKKTDKVTSKPAVKKRKNKPRTRQVKITQDSGDAPSISSLTTTVDEKIEKDLNQAVKIKKNQELIKAINQFNLSSYYSDAKLENVNKILNADQEEVNRFMIQKYQVDGNSLSNFAYGKILYTLDKLKDIEPDKKPIDIKDTNDVKKSKDEDNSFNTQNETVTETVTEDVKSKIDDLVNNVRETTEAISDNVVDNVKALKTKFGSEFIDKVEAGIKKRLEKEKQKNKDDEGLIDKIFNFREKLTEFLNPKNLLINTTKFMFSLPGKYKNFFFSDFAKKMRARERKFIGKMFKGVLSLPFKGLKGAGKLLGAAGSGLSNLIPGYGKFFGSKLAKKSRAKERQFLGKITGLSKLTGMFKNAKNGISSLFNKDKDSDRQEFTGKDRKNGWRERLAKLDAEKKAKKGVKADHVKADPKNSWLGKLLGPLLTMLPMALGKIVSWGANIFKPILNLTKTIVPGILKGIKWLGKGLTGIFSGGFKWLGKGVKWLGTGLGGVMSKGLKWLGNIFLGKSLLPSLPAGGGFLGKAKNLMTKIPGFFKGKFGKAALIGGAVAGGTWLYNKFFNSDDEEKESEKLKGNGVVKKRKDKIAENSNNDFDAGIDDKDLNTDAERKYEDYKKATERYKDKIRVPDFEENRNYDIRKDPRYINELIEDCANWEARVRNIEDGIRYYNDNKKPYPFLGKINKAYIIGNRSRLIDANLPAKELEKRLEDAKDKYELLSAKYNKLIGKKLSEKEENVLSGNSKCDYRSMSRKEFKILEEDIRIIANCKADLQMIKDKYEYIQKFEEGYIWDSELYNNYLNQFEIEYKKKWMVKGVIPPPHKERDKEALNFKKQYNIWKNKLKKLKETGEAISKDEMDLIDEVRVNDESSSSDNSKPKNKKSDKKQKPKQENSFGKDLEVDFNNDKISNDFSNDFNTEEFDGGSEQPSEDSGIVESAIGVADTAFTAKMAYDVAKGVKNKISPTAVTEASKGSGMFGWMKDKAGSLWDKAKTVGGKVLNKAKEVLPSVVSKAKEMLPGAASNKIKNIAGKILGILKGFKSLAFKKLGKTAGLKLVARLTAKIGSRAIPIAGWALLLADAAQIAWYVFKKGMKIAAAVSLVILGFNLLDDDSQALDEDGNPIQPDDNDPNPEATQREYYRELEKTNKVDEDKLKDIEKSMGEQYDVPENQKLTNKNNSFNNENKTDQQPNTESYNSFSEELKKRRTKQSYNGNNYTVKNIGNNNQSYNYSGSGGSNKEWSQMPEDESSSGEYITDVDLEKDPTKAQLNDVDYIKSLFTFYGYDENKFKRYNKVSPAEAFTLLNTDFKERLVGLAKDYMSATGKKLQVNSAFRTSAYQGVLQGAGPKASPGNSTHNFGIAADIQMGEAKGGPGLMTDLGKPRGYQLLRKWGLWRPLWGSNYSGRSPEDWHVEPVWSNSIAKNQDGWERKIRTVGSGGIRTKYNVKDENATKAVELFRQGNLTKFGGGSVNNEPKLDNNVAGGSVNQDSNIAENTKISQPNIETNNEDLVEKKPTETALNTQPPIENKPSVSVTNDNENIIANNNITKASEVEMAEAKNDKTDEAMDKTIAVNEEQLDIQKQHLNATNKLIALLENQNETRLKEDAKAALENSRIQNQIKQQDTSISNSPEENLKKENTVNNTNRPGQAFDLTRRV